ncbi:hypothetical protein KTJ32_19145 [Acinetobacter gyllenbergii]|nr:hypothetical protein [Acinetobacter gyllenbergii]
MFKGKGQGVVTYCLDSNNKVNIVSPTFGEILDYKGGKLKLTNYNVDTVLFRYYKWGVICANDFIEILLNLVCA